MAKIQTHAAQAKIFSAAMLLKQRLRTLHFQSATNRRQSPATTEGARAGAVDEMTSADLRLRFVTSNRLLPFPLLLPTLGLSECSIGPKHLA